MFADCAATRNDPEPVSRYYSVMWCKVSKKKVDVPHQFLID